jgi:hypothetical protein
LNAKRPRTLGVAILLGCTVLTVFAVLLLPALPQPLSYHRFADNRTLFGIPNGLNVLSNLVFLWIGVSGLHSLRSSAVTVLTINSHELTPYRGFFAGIALTAVGSSYYHLVPNNASLLWDRLPLIVAFMGLLVAMLAERVSAKLGAVLLWPLVGMSMVSVAW